MIGIEELPGADAHEVLDVVDVAAGRVDRGAVVQVDRPAQLRGRHWAAVARRAPGERDRVSDGVGRRARRGGDLHDRRRADRQLGLLGVGEAARIGHAQADRDVAFLGVGAAGRGGRGVVVRAVAVEVPRVREGVRVRVGRAGGVEVDLERRVAGLRGGRERGRRRLVRVDGADPLDRAAADVRVVEVAGRAHLEVDRGRRAVHEDLTGGRVGRAVRAGEHHPDAVARVVGEEHRALVGGREGAAVVELDAGDRRGADGAVLGGHLRAVVVRVQRRARAAGGVQVAADVEPERLVARLAPAALVARPAVVADLRRDVRDPVDLLPGQPANVARVDVGRARPEGEAERVAQAVGDDPAVVDRAGAGVAGERIAGVGIHADDRPVEPGGVGGREGVEAAERPALGGRRGLGLAGGARMVAAGVDRRAVLAVVGERVAGAVAGADVERAVRAELQVAERVARILLAPVVLDQRDLGAVGQDLREPAADDAAVALGAGRVGAVVVPARGGGADRRVVRVRDVHVGPARRELRVQDHAHEPAVVVPGDVLREVRVDARARVVEPVVDLDDAVELGDEHATVGREGERRRRHEVVERRLLDEVVGHVGGSGEHPGVEGVVVDAGSVSGRRREQEQRDERGEESEHDRTQP